MREADDLEGGERGEAVGGEGVDLVALQSEEGDGGQQGEELGLDRGQLVVGEVEGLEREIGRCDLIE